MRHLVLGTAGHIDHGKTALVRALTGEDTDRLPEEKRRGITIDLGFARLLLPSVEYAVVDVPGHESLVRNMLAGASGIDIVLLVVAADEGVMPQTREHLAIMQLLAVPNAVVAITKTDLVDGEWLELVADETRSILAESGFAEAPIIPVSAVTGTGLELLRAELDAAAERCGVRAQDDWLRLPIDRVFTIRGTGTVVTGTIWSGRVHDDTTLRALPGELAVRVRGLQRHGVTAPEAVAGERVALAVAAPRAALQRGTTLVDNPAWEPSSTLTVRLQLLSSSTVKARQRVHLHLGTAEVLARVALLGRDVLGPADEAWAQLRLEEPVVARAGDRFVIRSYSPVHTIAGGVVAEPLAGKRKRLGDGTAEHLQAVLAGTSPARAVVALAGSSGALTPRLPLLTGLPPGHPAAIPAGDVYAAGDRCFPLDLKDAVRQRVLAAVHACHQLRPLEPGASREELRRASATDAPSQLLEQVLRDLVAERRLLPVGPAYAEPGFRPSLNPEHGRLAEALRQTLADAGLAAPRLPELPDRLRLDPQLTAVARHLADQGILVMLAHDHFADARVVDVAAETLRAAFAEQPRQSASRLKEVLGLTRKHLIPLLEFFDRAGLTRREGDERVLGQGAQNASGEAG